MKIKHIIFELIAFAFLILNVSCSSDSVHIDGGIVIGGDDDFICDISDGFSFVGASINSRGEWVACGTEGIAFGNGSRNDFHIISLFTGDRENDKRVSLNDNGNYIALFDTGIYYGDLTGYLSQLDSTLQGQYLSAKINNHDIWITSSDQGVYIGEGEQTPVFLDYVANEGEPTEVALNDSDEFVVVGSLQVIYGYVDDDGNVNLYSTDPVSAYYDIPGVAINQYGDFIATGSIQTITGSAAPQNPKIKSVIRKNTLKIDLSGFKNIAIKKDIAKNNNGFKVKYHYKALFRTLKTRKKINLKDHLVEYHSADINDYQDYIAGGYNYLIVNGDNYPSVTKKNEMIATAIDRNGNWVAAGTYGLYYNNSRIQRVMNSGDYLSLAMDENGNFICVTSKSVYTYSYQRDELYDQGPVSDINYPVAGDINNNRWIAVGNYGILLWNY